MDSERTLYFKCCCVVTMAGGIKDTEKCKQKLPRMQRFVGGYQCMMYDSVIR
jgi:hypothetical protein